MQFISVAKVSEIPPGTGRVVYVEDVAVALFNVNGEFFAIDNTCKHRGGPLGEGELDSYVVTCPLHGWQYDIRTGAALMHPVAVTSYKVKVEGDEVKVSID